MKPDNENKEIQFQAIKEEFNSLIAHAFEDRKKRFAEASEWLDTELGKALTEIVKPTGQHVSKGRELADMFLERIQVINQEANNTIKKIGNDSLEKLKDVQFAGRAEELLNEINAAEWKKYFGDL